MGFVTLDKSKQEITKERLESLMAAPCQPIAVERDRFTKFLKDLPGLIYPPNYCRSGASN